MALLASSIASSRFPFAKETPARLSSSSAPFASGSAAPAPRRGQQQTRAQMANTKARRGRCFTGIGYTAPPLGASDLVAQPAQSKHQKPSSKHQRNPKFQAPNRSPRLELGAWSFSGVWSLVFGVWDLVLLWSLEFGIWSLSSEPDSRKTTNVYSPFEENWSSLFLNNRLKVVSEP